MPRIRTIKPDAFLSESLSSVPRGTRWTFAGLWTYADDEGRARDDARLVKAALYPLDDEISLSDVRHDLDLLANIGGICRYEAGGRHYLHMPKWMDHQRVNRPTPSKLPPCPVHDGAGTPPRTVPNASLSNHGVLTEDSHQERKGREGKKEGEGETSRKRAARRLPDDFQPTEDHISLAAGLSVNLDHEFAKFCDYWRGEGKAKADWNATLRNWIRRAAEDRQGNLRAVPQGGGFPHDGTEAEKDAWVAAQPLPADGTYYGGSRR